jgi:hypothetical protein
MDPFRLLRRSSYVVPDRKVDVLKLIAVLSGLRRLGDAGPECGFCSFSETAIAVAIDLGTH